VVAAELLDDPPHAAGVANAATASTTMSTRARNDALDPLSALAVRSITEASISHRGKSCRKRS
jgi:hypothetical protein